MIPIVTIFIGNSVIIFSTIKANIRRNTLQNFHNRKSTSVRESPLLTRQSVTLKKHTSKITKMMIIISLSYAILNLAYTISWSIFFYISAFKKEKMNDISKNYLFAVIQIAEIFYILNYAIHFYFLIFSGQNFRNNILSMFKCVCCKCVHVKCVCFEKLCRLNN